MCAYVHLYTLWIQQKLVGDIIEATMFGIKCISVPVMLIMVYFKI